MTQHFHFIFGNEIAVRLQITQSGKCYHKLFINGFYRCIPFIYLIVFMVHKVIHLQPLSFVGLRLILWGRQNSGCSPYSGGHNSPRDQDLPEVRGFCYYALQVLMLFPLGQMTNFAEFTIDSWNGVLWLLEEPQEMMSNLISPSNYSNLKSNVFIP